MIHTVLQADPPHARSLGSLGDAAYQLIRQINFPWKYDTDLDKLSGWDSDRIRSNMSLSKFNAIFQHHVGTGEMALGGWAERASEARVLAFCIEILQPFVQVAPWTGCRILGTVHRGNGFVVWTIELFAKGEGSTTEVYSDPVAPNVKPLDDRYDPRGVRLVYDRY